MISNELYPVYDILSSHFLLQYTEEGVADRENPYLDLGNVSPLDLISFAYQIASGMVLSFCLYSNHIYSDCSVLYGFKSHSSITTGVSFQP